MTAPVPHCQHKRSDGTPCHARSLAGASYCFFHDPSKAREREIAQRTGGQQHRARTLPADIPDLPLQSATDILRALELVFNATLKGQIDAKVGNATTLTASCALRAIEQAKLEDRLSALEKILKTQPQGQETPGATGDPLALPSETRP